MKHTLAAILIAFGCSASAETLPYPSDVDPRSATAIYEEGEVFRINVRLRRVTLIVFPEGERFLDFKGGDTESFLYSETPNGDGMLVKPVVGGAVSNGVIITNRRFYLVEFHESSTTRPHYAVTFVAPENERQNDAPQVPAGDPMRYALTTATQDATIAPVRVYDDGRKTYFEFSPDAPIPSIYRADASGQEYIVNARTDGVRVTVSARSERWVIRYGDEYVCVVNVELLDE